MNLFDSLVAMVSPQAGVRRAYARQVLAAYEAAKPSRQRKFHKDQGGINRDVSRGARALRVQARHLVQNHDLSRGALRVLVNNTVGPNGIGIEPQPRRTDGTIHEEYAKALLDAYRNWARCPEVTHEHSWQRVQRIGAWTWFMDGEFFAQRLIGNVPYLDHGTLVPYSLEMMDPDLIPLDYDSGDNIRQGIERNGWGRKTAFYALKSLPNDVSFQRFSTNYKRIPADRMFHVARLERFHQIRGVSEFASVITRLEDIKDYEESERVAAKVAAMMTGYVKKGNQEFYDPSTVDTDETGAPIPRELRLTPGMIIDNLAPGEEVGLIDSNRPNPNLITFRQGQLRACAAGWGASYSSVSRDYNGTWSAQRQELVEQWMHYAVLADDFTGMFVQPVWEDFVLAAHLSGVVPRPADVLPHEADNALFIAQSMPWIDPIKEAKAWSQLVQDGFASEVEVIRRRGGNPHDVLNQIQKFRDDAKSRGLVLSSDAANNTSAPQPVEAVPPVEDQSS